MANISLDQTVFLWTLIDYGLISTLAVMLAVLALSQPAQGTLTTLLTWACSIVMTLCGMLCFMTLATRSLVAPTTFFWINAILLEIAVVWPGCIHLIQCSDPISSCNRRITWGLGIGMLAMGSIVIFVATVVPSWPRFGPWVLLQSLASAGYVVLSALFYENLTSRRQFNSTLYRMTAALIPLGPMLTLLAQWIKEFGVFSDRWRTMLEVLPTINVCVSLLGGIIITTYFHLSDRFAKVGLFVVCAWALGASLSWILYGPSIRTTHDAIVVAVICSSFPAAVLLTSWMSFAIDRFVDRTIFGNIPPQVALDDLRELLVKNNTLAEIFSVVEIFLHDTMNVDSRLSPWVNGVSKGRSIEIGNQSRYELSLLPKGRRRVFFACENELLHQVTVLLGRKLEAMEREQERANLLKRETQLMLQATKAELRALRAQINPHFLFNSLNTIAAMVHEDSMIAETMTLRLAQVFRYVLTKTNQSFVPLHEEIDFLRAYLEIEQMRFGERLQVEFIVSSSVSQVPIPSLILQPLIENAIKHGLAPKIGECSLIIKAHWQNGLIVLTVSDNGVGIGQGNTDPSKHTGIGLHNIRERLAAEYGSQASLTFKSKPHCGSVSTIQFPLRDETEAVNNELATQEPTIRRRTNLPPVIAQLIAQSLLPRTKN